LSTQNRAAARASANSWRLRRRSLPGQPCSQERKRLVADWKTATARRKPEQDRWQRNLWPRLQVAGARAHRGSAMPSLWWRCCIIRSLLNCRLTGSHRRRSHPNGIAVVANTYWQAKNALDALNVEFNEGSAAAVNTNTLRDDYRGAMDGNEWLLVHVEGNADALHHEYPNVPLAKDTLPATSAASAGRETYPTIYSRSMNRNSWLTPPWSL